MTWRARRLSCATRSPVPNLECRRLTAHDVPSTAALLARAFLDNPCYMWMHPREGSRPADLRAFFERNLLWHLSLDLTWVALRGDRVAGTFTLEPPGGVKYGIARMLTHWVLPTLRQQGPMTVRRIAQADAAFRTRYRAFTEGRDYWHVHAVAVDPDYQGKGVGASMLTHCMRELASLRSHATAPVVLSTQREKNLPFYRRAGFELVNRQEMGSTGRRFVTWFMRLPDVGQ